MKLTIFKSDGTSRDIDNVVKVLTHSVGTASGGIDLEVSTQEYEGLLILTESIHLDTWDFYSVRP